MSPQVPASDKQGSDNKQSQQENNVTLLCAPEYAKHNGILRKYNEFVLDFCKLAFTTTPDSSQQFLDVGCGPGDFTRDVLLSHCLPCRRIVGVDFSREMIEYARRNSAHEKIDFAVLDIAADVSQFLDQYGHFERVYSFYCLNWVDDLSAAVKNISRLMTPTGECVLGILCGVRGCRFLEGTRRNGSLGKTLTKYVPKTQDLRDRKELLTFLSRILQEAGLFPTIQEVLISTCLYNWSEEDVLATYMNTLPIIKLISDEEKLQLSADVKDLIRNVQLPGLQNWRYKMFIVKASKSPF
ncbi:hypothetical protein HPB50_018957 [Hyalomma asiaticum]|uniref:Uncharacterized protein n=1 Tax=Hyalomma asiaticum TaxID=266040 RepID=A0ACB7RRL2_HYAAI|nr:hypothetical protein HPB50_018957 [Hyalomma asiaticum]